MISFRLWLPQLWGLGQAAAVMRILRKSKLQGYRNMHFFLVETHGPGTSVQALKKDLHWREGKGRRCCLGDKIDLIKHNRFSARMIWRDGFIEKWTFGGMDALETLMIFQFTMHETTTL